MSPSSEEFLISLVPERDDRQTRGDELAGRARRDRRESYRVPLSENARADWGSACRLTDISAGGVGFLAPRGDAPLLENALVLVHVAGTRLFRAIVQRVDLGGSSEEWVRVGARFVGLATGERASLSALVAAQCS